MRLFDNRIVSLLNQLFEAHQQSPQRNISWWLFLQDKRKEYPFPATLMELSTTQGFPWFITIYYCSIFFTDESTPPENIATLIKNLLDNMLFQLYAQKTVLKAKLLARFCGNKNLTKDEMLAYQKTLPQTIFSTPFEILKPLRRPIENLKINYELLTFIEPDIWISQEELILSFSPTASYKFTRLDALKYVLVIFNNIHLFQHSFFYCQRMEHRFFIHIAILTLLEFLKLNWNDPPRCLINLVKTEKSQISLGSNLSSVTFGGMYASCPKMLGILVALTILEPAPANNLINIYNSYQLDCSRKQKWDIIKQFSDELEKTDFKPTNYLLRLIGDTVADRGRNDFFMLLIFQKLHNIKQNFSVLFSSHDASLILFYKTLINKKNKFYFHIKDLEDISLRELIFVVSKIPCGNTSEISDLTDILFTGFYNDNPWALFNKLMPIYLEHSRLLEVEERSGNVYLFTHAPTTYTYCLNMLKEQGLQNNGIQVFYDLYNFYLQKQDAFLGFFEKVEDVPQSYIHGMELAMPNRSLAFNFVWNRSFDLNYPAEENIKFINIIGHVGKNEELSSDQRLIFRTRKVVNLDDSYLGKEDFSVTDSNLPRADNIPFFALYQN